MSEAPGTATPTVPAHRPLPGRIVPAVGVAVGIALAAHLALSAAYLVRNHGFGAVLAVEGGFDAARLEAVQDVGILEFCCPHSATFVNDPDVGDRTVLEVELRPDDPDMRGSKRAELRLKAAPFGQDVWYRAHLRVADDWTVGPDIVTVLQWHAVDDRHLGEAGRAPPLRLVVHEGRWKIASHWDARILTGVPFLGGEPSGGALLWEGPIEPETWTEWVFHVRWAYDEGEGGEKGRGELNVWKDGEPIVERRGPNTYNDVLAPFFKAGIYIPAWAQGSVGTRAPRSLLIGEVQEHRASLAPWRSP